MLIHGESKAGKSTVAASLPKPLLYLDVESAARFLPLRKIVWDPRNPPPKVDKAVWDTCVVAVREWTDAVLALDWLKYHDHPFRSVSVDSISELQYRNIEATAGRDQVKIADWGQVLREVGGFVRDLRDLTMHPFHPLRAVCITSMSKVEGNGFIHPQLQGQLSGIITYLMDITAYLSVEVGPGGVEKRVLRTRRLPGRIEAGERVGGRILPLIELPVVSGDTQEEISRKNTIFQRIMRDVFQADAPLVAPPAVTSEVPVGPGAVPAVPADGNPAAAPAVDESRPT